jgi:hypothetical protein
MEPACDRGYSVEPLGDPGVAPGPSVVVLIPGRAREDTARVVHLSGAEGVSAIPYPAREPLVRGDGEDGVGV